MFTPIAVAWVSLPPLYSMDFPSKIKIGDKLPDIKLFEFIPGKLKAVYPAQLSQGCRVVIFSLPGAFTPLCTTQHLPAYMRHAAAFKAHGISLIACTAVNDGFVIAAWGKSLNVGEEIKMWADGNAEFVKALGLEEDLSRLGFGIRGRRFSMLVSDGCLEALFVETKDEVNVSSAEHMLEYLAGRSAGEEKQVSAE